MAKKRKKKKKVKKRTAKRKKTKTKKRKTKKKATKKKKGKKRKANKAFMKAVTPSPALAAIVGSKPLPRTQVIKKLWIYIKKKKLQNPKNRRSIIADAKLKPVFGGKKEMDMFKMMKAISKHIKGNDLDGWFK